MNNEFVNEFVAKYINNFKRFTLTLEDSENRITENENVNMELTSKREAELQKVKNMTFADSNETSEERFEEWKRARIALLSSPDERVAHNQNIIDEAYENIRIEVEKEQDRLNNLLRMLEAQKSVIENDLRDLYDSQQKAKTHEAKVSYSVLIDEKNAERRVIEESINSMHYYKRFMSKVSASFAQDGRNYSIDSYLEELEAMNTSIEHLEFLNQGANFNDLVIDLEFDPSRNVYKVNCLGGNVSITNPKEFTLEQLTPEALQYTLDKYAEKIASYAKFTTQEIKDKVVKCKINGQEVGKAKLGVVGETLNGALNNNLSNQQQNQQGQNQNKPAQPVQPTQPAVNQPTQPVKEEPKAEEVKEEPKAEEVIEPPVVEEEPEVEENQQAEEVPEYPDYNEEQINDEELQNNSQPTKRILTSEDRRRLTMENAIKVKSARRSTAYYQSTGLVIGGIIAAGLGLAVGGPLTLIGSGLVVSGGLRAVYDYAVDASAARKYNSFVRKINNVAKKINNAFGKENVRSGLKVSVVPTEDYKLKFQISQGDRKVLVDSNTTGILGETFGWSELQTDQVVRAFNYSLDKEFPTINDPNRREKYYDEAGVSTITVDTLEQVFTEFGGYHFGNENKQFGMLEKAKDNTGKPIRSLFKPFKKSGRGIHSTAEKVVKKLTEEKANSGYEGRSKVEDAELEIEDLDAALEEEYEFYNNDEISNHIDVAELDKMLNEEEKIQEEVVPQQSKEYEAEYARMKNELVGYFVQQFEQWPETAELEDEQRVEIANQIASLDDQGMNEVVMEYKTKALSGELTLSGLLSLINENQNRIKEATGQAQSM